MQNSRSDLWTDFVMQIFQNLCVQKCRIYMVRSFCLPAGRRVHRKNIRQMSTSTAETSITGVIGGSITSGGVVSTFCMITSGSSRTFSMISSFGGGFSSSLIDSGSWSMAIEGDLDLYFFSSTFGSSSMFYMVSTRHFFENKEDDGHTRWNDHLAGREIYLFRHDQSGQQTLNHTLYLL